MKIYFDMPLKHLQLVIFSLLFMGSDSRASSLKILRDAQGLTRGVEITAMKRRTAVLVYCMKTTHVEIRCSNGTFIMRGDTFNTVEDPPVRGSYNGVDGTGLFWSAVGAPAVPLSYFGPQLRSVLAKISPGDAALILRRAREDDGGIEIILPLGKKEQPITMELVDAQGVQGRLIKPEGPAVANVLSVGGCPASGSPTALSGYLAKHGFLVFQVFYTAGLNRAVTTTCSGDVAVLEKSLDLLQHVSPTKKNFVYGASRGGAGALWLAHFNKKRIFAVATVNGSHIQLPSEISHPWTYKGKDLPRLGSAARNYYLRIRQGVAKIGSNVGSLDGPPKTQRGYFEEILASYTQDELRAASIPIDCALPRLSIFAGRDELVATSYTIRALQSQCPGKVNSIVREEATHSSFEIGNEENRACMHGDNGLSKLHCKSNIQAGDRNARDIVTFFKAVVEGRVVHTPHFLK